MPCNVSYSSFRDHRLRPQCFFLRLVFVELTLYTLHKFASPDGRIIIDFAFRNDSLKTSIFRRFTYFMKNIHVGPFRTLSVNSISYRIKKVGQRAGFNHSFQSYALRCEMGTGLTDKSVSWNTSHIVTANVASDRGFSDQQRNQILGHA